MQKSYQGPAGSNVCDENVCDSLYNGERVATTMARILSLVGEIKEEKTATATLNQLRC